MMEEKMRINKIPLEELIEALVKIYNGGANYIDIIGAIEDDQDIIGLDIKEDYMLPIEKEIQEEEEVTSPLSEEDFNNIM